MSKFQGLLSELLDMVLGDVAEAETRYYNSSHASQEERNACTDLKHLDDVKDAIDVLGTYLDQREGIGLDS